jgi:hypothetical protein
VTWCSLLGQQLEEALARAHAIMLEEGPLVWGDARPSNFRLRRFVALHAHAR